MHRKLHRFAGGAAAIPAAPAAAVAAPAGPAAAAPATRAPAEAAPPTGGTCARTRPTLTSSATAAAPALFRKDMEPPPVKKGIREAPLDRAEMSLPSSLRRPADLSESGRERFGL